MVVSGGRIIWPESVSSKPSTETSSGTLIPKDVSALIAPIAMLSARQKSAVIGAEAAMRLEMGAELALGDLGLEGAQPQDVALGAELGVVGDRLGEAVLALADGVPARPGDERDVAVPEPRR